MDSFIEVVIDVLSELLDSSKVSSRIRALAYPVICLLIVVLFVIIAITSYQESDTFSVVLFGLLALVSAHLAIWGVLRAIHRLHSNKAAKRPKIN